MKDRDQGITAYPLCWPAGRPRKAHRKRAVFHRVKKEPYNTPSGQQWTRASRTKPTIEQARQRVSDELARLGARRPIISSNLELRNDGLPRSNQRQPSDPAVAVYFDLGEGGQKCIAIDLWDRVEDNLVAIAKSIDAMRGLERWGGAEIVAAVFTGFKALPDGSIVVPMTVEQAAAFLSPIASAGSDSKPTPAQIMAHRETFNFAYRVAVQAYHPDRNGGVQHPQWNTLQAAADILERHHG